MKLFLLAMLLLASVARGQDDRLFFSSAWEGYSSELDGAGVVPLNIMEQSTAIAVDRSGRRIFSGGSTTIWRMDLSTGALQTIVTGIDVLWDIEFDSTEDKVYFADHKNRRIGRCNSDGTMLEWLVTTGISRPTGIAIDPEAEKLYFCDVRRIQRCNLDGTMLEELLDFGLTFLFDLELDPGSGKMYWTEWSHDRIRRANLDGSAMEDLYHDQWCDPGGLALDLRTGKMYWAERWGQPTCILRANFDGSAREVVVETGLDSPWGVELDIPEVPARCETCGDCNWNGTGPDIVDSLAAARVATRSYQTPLEIRCCDVDSSGTVDIVDSLRIAQAAASLSVGLVCP